MSSLINKCTLPAINVSKPVFCTGCTIPQFEIFPDPFNEVILECTFHQLVKDIWGQELTNVSTGKSSANGCKANKNKV